MGKSCSLWLQYKIAKRQKSIQRMDSQAFELPIEPNEKVRMQKYPKGRGEKPAPSPLSFNYDKNQEEGRRTEKRCSL